MKITSDPEKRRKTLDERGLDFCDAVEAFGSIIATREDDRRAYSEPRFITAAELRSRVVAVVWTPTDDGRRLISMRYAHAKETRAWRSRVG